MNLTIPEEPHGSLADLLVQLEEWKGRIEEAIEIRENEAAEEAAEEEVEEEVGFQQVQMLIHMILLQKI